MTKSEMEVLIYKVIDKNICPVNADFFKLGILTSFKLVRLYSHLEKESGITLSVDKILEFSPRTVSQIIEMYYLNDGNINE